MLRNLNIAANKVPQRELRDVRAIISGGAIPMCSFCKKVRDENGDWLPPETYVSNRVDFTHGICPECAKLYFGEILDEPDASPES